MEGRNVRVTTRDAFAHVTLARPERRNTLSLEVIEDLLSAFAEIGAGKTRGVLLDAEGPVFSAGHDFADMAGCDLAGTRALLVRCAEMMQRIQRIPQPVLASVAGLATAAGCQLVSMCDLAVAADTARFALPGVNVGVFCTTPAVGVARNIARKRVMELLLTGEPIDAATALAWGLVNRVVPLGELDAAIGHFTRLIGARSARLIGQGKQAFYRQVDLGLEAAYGEVSGTMACSLLDAHAHEGIDAFIEKRTPHWDE